MISLEWLFYLQIVFFGLIGSLRGWQKEVIALAGLIGSVSALTQFGFLLVTLVGRALNQAALDPSGLQRRAFWIQFAFHVTIAFFSYQVIARIADTAPGSRFGEKLRMGFQNRFIGAVVGLLNGYLLVGTLWALLEFELTDVGYIRRIEGQPYVFDPSVVVRPLYDPSSIDVVAYLPFEVLSPALWLVLFFISFFIVIIALI